MELTAELLRSLLHYDPQTGVFTRIPSGRKVGTISVRGAVVINLLRRSFYAHRLAWLYVHGQWPVDEIDHISGDQTQNMIRNLREATRGQNAQNKRAASKKNKSSGMLGVTWAIHANKWKAQIAVNYKTYHLGYFTDPKEAHHAYVLAKRKLHEFCMI